MNRLGLPPPIRSHAGGIAACSFAIGKRPVSILGLLTRGAELVAAFVFVVALWMVHWPQDCPGWWRSLILAGVGILFARLGPGRYALDSLIAGRRTDDRDRVDAASPW